MRNLSHPNFILGAVAILLLFIGVGMRANSFRAGDYVLMASLGLGAIHWIWAIVEVLKGYRVNKSASEDRDILWVILVILVPAAGSMMYYLWGSKVRV